MHDRDEALGGVDDRSFGLRRSGGHSATFLVLVNCRHRRDDRHEGAPSSPVSSRQQASSAASASWIPRIPRRLSAACRRTSRSSAAVRARARRLHRRVRRRRRRSRRALDVIELLAAHHQRIAEGRRVARRHASFSDRPDRPLEPAARLDDGVAEPVGQHAVVVLRPIFPGGHAERRSRLAQRAQGIPELFGSRAECSSPHELPVEVVRDHARPRVAAVEREAGGADQEALGDDAGIGAGARAAAPPPRSSAAPSARSGCTCGEAAYRRARGTAGSRSVSTTSADGLRGRVEHRAAGWCRRADRGRSGSRSRR